MSPFPVAIPIMTAPFLHKVVVGLVGAMTACSPSAERESTRSPTLIPADSVQLAETDSTFVGEPSGFAIGADGSFIISDRRNAVVHRYSRSGAHLASIGRRGDGPDEWSRGPFFVKAENDVMAVADGNRFKTLEYPSGRVLTEVQRPAGSGFVAFEDGSAYFRHIDRSKRTTFEVIGEDGSTARGGSFTQAMGRSLTVDNMFSFIAVAPLSEKRMAIAYQNSDYVFFGPIGGPFDSVAVPVLHRRGSRPDLLNAIEDGNPETAKRAAYQPSYPFLLSATSMDALLAYVTIDQTFEGNRMTGQPFLSVVDLTRRQACPDARVPGPIDPQPWIAIVGDTAFVLTQDEGPGGRPRSMVHSLVIDHDTCWGTP